MLSLEDFGITNNNSIHNYRFDPSSKYGKGGFQLSYNTDFYAGDNVSVPKFVYNNRELFVMSFSIDATHRRADIFSRNKYELHINIGIQTSSYKQSYQTQTTYTYYTIDFGSHEKGRNEFSIDTVLQKIKALSFRLFVLMDNGFNGKSLGPAGFEEFEEDGIKYHLGTYQYYSNGC